MSDYFYSFEFCMSRYDCDYFWPFYFVTDGLANEENQ